ncbi:MAG: esterase family protein [Acidobacteria bacterium]|nr:esterase family protein [Acidobacteriota bacterium]
MAKGRMLKNARLAAAALALVFALAACASSQSQPGATPSPQAAAAKGRVEYTEFDSPSLGQKVRCAISLPASYDLKKTQRYPVVVFLHGLNNDERSWEIEGMQARLEELRAAGKVGDFIVAMPYGANSFYLNAKDGARYEDAIVKDFLPFVDKNYRTTAKPASRVIEGISMGGYGALLIAFKHPELFSAVAAHSAALFDELPAQPTDAGDRRAGYRYMLATKLFGAPPDLAYFQTNNPLQLARANAAAIKSLKIYFDVGDHDRYGFQGGNQKLDATLTELGVRHEFALAPGDHGWSFLNARSEQALAFVWNALAH